MIFFLINFGLFLSSYFLLSSFSLPLTSRLIGSGLISFAQIIMTEIFLGTVGLLYLPHLIVLNAVISAVFFVLSFRKLPVIKKTISADLILVAKNRSIFFIPYNSFLMMLIGFLTAWYILAAQFFPPARVADDMVYHLPPIYEFIISGKISLLPIGIRPHMAFPFNAEFLFMWPAIFSHNDKWIGLVQYAVALYGVAVTYALGRLILLEPKIALFTALQFIFAPVVLAQAGSAYIDITTSVFFLTVLYFILRYYKYSQPVELYLAAVALGLTCGMKHGALMLCIILMALIIPRIIKQKHFLQLCWFFFLVFLFGGYWYVRNWIVLGNPLFPLDLLKGGLGTITESGPAFTWEKIAQIPLKAKQLIFGDTGVGSLHGGFGMTFWGIAFPSWLYLFSRTFSLRDKAERVFFLILWSQVLLGILMLLILPMETFHLVSRYSIFIIPIGLLAFGHIIQIFKNRIYYRLFLIFLSCWFSVLSFIRLADVSMPTYAVDVAIDDIRQGRKVSKFSYYDLSDFMTRIWIGWEALDFLTKNDPPAKPLTCYMAADIFFFNMAPVYGSQLQNRVWNLQENPQHPPDAMLFYSKSGQPFYLGKPITLKDAIFDPQYTVFITYYNSFLLIKNDFFKENPDKIQRLIDFYSLYYYDSNLEELKQFTSKLNPAFPIVGAFPEDHTLKVMELKGMLASKVYLLPPNGDLISEFLKDRDIREFYTYDYECALWNPQITAEFSIAGKKHTIYLNTLK